MIEIKKDTIIGDILDVAPQTAPIFLSIGMHCLGCPSSRGETVEQACMVHGVDVDELLAKADFITLHTLLTDETRNLINAQRLAAMKKTAVLINTARGGLIDEDALLAALREGRIHGAGLDVFEQEPPANPAWYALDNLVMGSHCSSSTAGATEQMGRMAVANLLRDLALRADEKDHQPRKHQHHDRPDGGGDRRIRFPDAALGEHRGQSGEQRRTECIEDPHGSPLLFYHALRCLPPERLLF